MRIFHMPAPAAYHPRESFFTGRFTPYPDVPARERALLDGLAGRPGCRVEVPPPLAEGAALRVHDAGYLASLRGLCDRLRPDEVFFPFHMAPHARLAESPFPRLRMGAFALDGSTPLLPSSWEAGVGAAASALAGAQVLAGGGQEAYALCRPPGHHAGRASFAGYCLLNNAALAADALTALGKVAILDVDYHHGNGTQEIFWERNDVFYASLHCRPEEAYPYISGTAEEAGSGAGRGQTLNLPLPGGTPWPAYRSALLTALERLSRENPQVLVLSLGFDTLAGDPIGSFALQAGDYQEMGSLVKNLGLPTLIVQEGGYRVEALGECLRAFLDGWEDGNLTDGGSG